MAQVINTNSLSLITQNNINKNQSALSSSIERLSSGLRINSAKDDAAGQAIANRFTSNIKGLTQAARNANDGISLAQTTEGALSEINNNLQRVRELTVQATTGTNSDSDLSSIQDEIKSRLDEIDRVSGQTQFNGVKVLAKDDSMKIQVGANDGQTISIDLKKIDSSTLGLSGFNVEKASKITTEEVEVDAGYKNSTTAVDKTAPNFGTLTATTNTSVTDVTFDADKGTYYATLTDADNTNTGTYTATLDAAGKVTVGTKVTDGSDANAVTTAFVKESAAGTADAATALNSLLGGSGATAANTKLVKLTAEDSNGNKTDAGYAVSYNDKLYATSYNGDDNKTIDVKSVDFKSSTGVANKAAVELGGMNGKTQVATVDGKTYEASKLKNHDFSDATSSIAEVTTVATANPLAKLDAAISDIDKFRSSLGAVQNRLDSAVTNLNNTTTNLSEAQSRIQDADYATEVSNMSKAQIIQQAGNSVLSKANQVPQQILSLLQG